MSRSEAATQLRRLRGALNARTLRSVVTLALVLAPVAASHSCAISQHFDGVPASRHVVKLITDCLGHSRDGMDGPFQHAC